MDSTTAPVVPGPKDDGIFGPGSMTWQIETTTACGIGELASVMIQLLHPRVMWMIDQSSTFRTDPTLRAQRTAQYLITTAFGDTAAVTRANELFNEIHGTLQGTDPVTGETYYADESDLQAWVHNSKVWGIVHAYQRWGIPARTPEELDRYVSEQRIYAKLMHISPETLVPGTVADLEAYMVAMWPKMAFNSATLWFRDFLLPSSPGITKKSISAWLLGRVLIDLFTPEQRELLGLRFGPIDHAIGDALAKRSCKKTAKPYEELLAQKRTEAATHAYGMSFAAKPKPKAE